jgi:hypothetical protein
MTQLSSQQVVALKDSLKKLCTDQILTDDEVMEILSVLNPENPKLERILYAAFCAIQGGDEDIEALYQRADHWMDYERS